MFLRTTPNELDDVLFTIVGNMNVGLRLIKAQEQKNEVARLNLQAGEKAIASSAFESAAQYLMAGITLLHENSWNDDYDLTIRLYDAASEALFVTGDFSSLSSIIQKPLIRAKSFEDKLNTYHSLVRFLHASGHLNEGISKCASILSQLGEIIPARVDNSVYMEEVRRVKQSLMNLSEEDLLSLPVMKDERKLVRCILGSQGSY